MGIFGGRKNNNEGRKNNNRPENPVTKQGNSPETSPSAEVRQELVRKLTEIISGGGAEEFFPEVLDSIAKGDLTYEQCRFLYRRLSVPLSADERPAWFEKYAAKIDNNYKIFAETDIKVKVEGMIELLGLEIEEKGEEIVPNIFKRMKGDSLKDADYEKIADKFEYNLLDIASRHDVKSEGRFALIGVFDKTYERSEGADLLGSKGVRQKTETAPDVENQDEGVPVEEEQVTGDGDVATQYAQAAHTVDHMLNWADKETLLSKKTRKEGVRRLLDEQFKSGEKPSADAGWVKGFLTKALDGMEVDSKKVSVVQNYITMKERFDTEQVQRMSTLTERMSENADEEAVEKALEALTIFEEQLMAEEVRLRGHMNGDSKAVAKVKKLWGYLGDRNAASFLEKKGIYKSGNTLWGKIAHSGLRALSFRSAAMAALVPLAGFGFGAAGVGAAIGLRRGIGWVMGASGGHALARRWLERNLKGRVNEISQLENLKDADHEQVIHLKKEYDAFILEHRANTAEEVGGGEEYENLQGMYRDAVKNFCNDADRAEKLRTKQNLSEVKARNIVRSKKNKAVLFGSAFLGGAVSAVVAPKVFEMAHDFGAGLTDTDLDGDDQSSGKKTSQDTSTTKKSQGDPLKPNPETAPIEAADSPAKNEDLSGTETDDTDKKQVPPENTTPPEPYVYKGTDTPPPEQANLDSEGPASSEGTNTDSTKAEEDLPTEEADNNPERTASAEGTDTDSTAEAEETPAERTREFVLEDGFYTVQEGDSLSKIWLAANGGDVEQMTAAMEALEKLEGSPEGVEQLKAFGIDSEKIALIHPDDRINVSAIQEWLESGDAQVDADTAAEEVPAQQTSTPETEESVADAAQQEGGGGEEVAQSAAEEQEGGAGEDKEGAASAEEKQESAEQDTPLPREDLDLPKGAEIVEHTAGSGENTVAKVLMHRGYNINSIPEEILWKEVHEGHTMDIHLTEDGQFLGVTVDGKDLMDEGALQRAADPNAAEQKGGSGERGEKVTPLVRGDLGLPKGAEVLQHTADTGENTVAKVLMHRGYDINTIPEEILWKEVHEGHDIDIYLTEDGQFLGTTVNGEQLMDESALRRAAEPVEVGAAAEMSVGEKLPFTDNFAGLVETAEALNADMLVGESMESTRPEYRTVSSRIEIDLPGSHPYTMEARELQQFRPDLFESDQKAIAATIQRNNTGGVIIQADYAPQKRILVETNQKGVLDHNYVQKEFDTIQKTLENPESIQIARFDVIRKAIQSLTVEKPPANPNDFLVLSTNLTEKISEDPDLADRMFSEKGWGDERIRVAYSDDQRSLEVQERVNVNKGKRNMRPRWAWKSVLVEKIAAKK